MPKGSISNKLNKTKETPKLGVSKALDYIRTNDKAKFDSTIEVHINLDLDMKKSENIRYSISLPHGTGKTKKVAVLGSKKVAAADLDMSEADIEKIDSGKIKPKVDFDVLIAEPKFMSKLAKVAKILGPAGVMPNPKNGTVTEDIEKAVDLFKKGRVEIRMEQLAPVIHTVIGKKSFSNTQLEENLREIVVSLKQNKPSKASPGWIKSVFVSATMSPSVEIVGEELPLL